jgi:aconitate hydratase
VSRYLESAGLLGDLAALGFHIVGYGCTTCIGNSGPLTGEMAAAVQRGVKAAAVLSGNRNFEGRLHPDVSGAYLMSPPLVVAFAIAGTVLVDPASEPLALDRSGSPVRLADLWPGPGDLQQATAHIRVGCYLPERRDLFSGDELWQGTAGASGPVFSWPATSTYLLRSPLVADVTPDGLRDIESARVLVFAADSTTTDHISPAGPVPARSQAAELLTAAGVPPGELNSYGCRRGNHEVMTRGTFANPRFLNKLSQRRGCWTTHFPTGDATTIYDAAMRYQAEKVPVIILAGRDYGMGSSRDWAAKGPRLLGVRAVLAQSFERIHRANLVGAGILPLQFEPQTGPASLGLRGDEVYDIRGLATLEPRGTVEVVARARDGAVLACWRMASRADTERDLSYIRGAGILSAVPSRLLDEHS